MLRHCPAHHIEKLRLERFASSCQRDLPRVAEHAASEHVPT